MDRPPHVRKVFLSAKCKDVCLVTLLTEDELIVEEHFGYPPAPFTDNEPGDEEWVSLEIDNATGCIVGWKPIETLKA